MFSKYFDHTILSANLTKNEIIKLCNEAKEYNFASVCVNPCYVKLCYEQLRNTDVNICTVVGFPLGSMTTESKLFETKEALKNGASEIDMVINIGKLKDKEYDYVKNEIKLLKDACGNKVLKVIIANTEVRKKERATKEDIELMRKAVGNELGIKASGGVRDLETVNCMIEAGATRIGSSSTVKIIKDYIELNK